MTVKSEQKYLHRYHISCDAKVRIQYRLKKLPRPTAANFIEFISSYFQVLAELSVDITKGIHELAWPSGPGFVVLENCPESDSIPTTPNDGNPSILKTQFVEEHFITAVGMMLGKPIAYFLEKSGELIANVIPVRGSEYKISNEGSKADLGLHVELAHYLALCPSFSLLYCLRPDPWDRAVTVIVDVRDLIPRLSPSCLSELRSPQFRIELPASFAVDGGETLSVPTPLIVGPDEYPQAFVEFNSTVPLNARASEALREMKVVCETSGIATDLRLKAGELLIINNYRALHGRRSFAPDWTRGSQRWLLRMNLVPEYWPYRHVMPASQQALITTAFIPQL
jgi:L-asparagine oxygenase